MPFSVCALCLASSKPASATRLGDFRKYVQTATGEHHERNGYRNRLETSSAPESDMSIYLVAGNVLSLARVSSVCSNQLKSSSERRHCVRRSCRLLRRATIAAEKFCQ